MLPFKRLAPRFGICPFSSKPWSIEVVLGEDATVAILYGKRIFNGYEWPSFKTRREARAECKRLNGPTCSRHAYDNYMQYYNDKNVRLEIMTSMLGCYQSSYQRCALYHIVMGNRK